ncbi:uncharacterized protein N7477_005411 [Penicillium maclennaniae]|uniref:uncharacterized protein n=1 Tax=Penicillium maclennaniae TaxID=1343394 RepID=UPI0025415748|nr:uncharacterized protein N7477_005411 [Penicillium maclennaniae]KAJ5670048.1 hypothetical protein N7477_005411 [Penicillium maclennaniae]
MLEATPISILVLGFLIILPILLFSKVQGWTHTAQSTILPRLGLRLWRPRQSSEIISLRMYPIKSCRGFEVQKTLLKEHGLDLDRRWMLVDAKTNEFLTIRQIPNMTRIGTALSDEGLDLIVTIPDIGSETMTTVRIPCHPSLDWLNNNTTIAPVKIWDNDTDGHIYNESINAPFSAFLGRPVALASLAELNSRLRRKGVDPITVERFRPNIVVRGQTPWSEDSWKTVRISGDGKPLDLDIVARCARCQVPNVDPDSAVKHKKQPWDTLVSYRRIDEGIKYKPCFGMLSAPRSEGVVEVGMRLEVLEETNEHRYITGF